MVCIRQDQNPPGASEAEKAAWSRAFIDDLPDAAFVVILPGGEVDADGLTAPRDLRKLPHHGPDVEDGDDNESVDVPHLRAALSRLPQTDLPEAQRRAASEHLLAHARALGVGVAKVARLADVLDRAHALLDFAGPIAKTIWGSPAGKKRLAKFLVGLLPEHKAYVEPFAGSAAVLFEKEPVETEVICDADPEIVEAYKLVKRLTPEGIARLRKMDWVGRPETFRKLIDTTPRDDVGRLYRFLYLSHFSYGKMRGKAFSPAQEGTESTSVDRIEKDAPRLKRVRVLGGDYEPVMRRFDGKDTAFFLDPPYAGYNIGVGEKDFDEDRFYGVLKGLKGRFLLTYGVRGKLPELIKGTDWVVKRIRPERRIRAMRGAGGPSVLTQLVVSNYAPAEKRLADLEADGWRIESEPLVVRDPVEVEIEKKQPFGTFGGSAKYAKRLVPLLPPHKTYVEPFAGAAALLHAKEPSEREVIADIDPDVVFLHRYIQGMTEKRLEILRKFDWKVSRASFVRARDMQPKDDHERFYKLVFFRTHAHNANPWARHPAQNHLGSTTDPEKYLKFAPRLRDVQILKQDWRATLKQFDGPDTFFFVDPPYPGEWPDKAQWIDVEEFAKALGALKGNFIAVLNDAPEHVAAFKRIGHIFRLSVPEALGTGGAKIAKRLFCANFRVRKADGLDWLDAAPFAKSVPLLKGADPADERYVLGVVLEPEVVDAQGDIYSAEEVRQAAHGFMEDFGRLGLMHRQPVDGQVKILESYLAPADFTLAETPIRKGTWLLAVRVLDDALWAQVKDGALAGFSIGGSAIRRPADEPQPTPADGATA